MGNHVGAGAEAHAISRDGAGIGNADLERRFFTRAERAVVERNVLRRDQPALAVEQRDDRGEAFELVARSPGLRTVPLMVSEFASRECPSDTSSSGSTACAEVLRAPRPLFLSRRSEKHHRAAQQRR